MMAEGALLPFQTQAIANLQSRLSGAVTSDRHRQPGNRRVRQISDRDGNALAYRRTTTQVINIVENGNGANHAGGFFPSGLNGNIR